ncbi:hypothetical protein C8D89_12546 [Actinomycetospora cinnamomea]|uniref:Uncharacterized protein n=1 Tax=Actinomycetospora cinnamomea TaxID=663609 RepID=A0A2U1EBI2_9PSEU|nr:hypothetical protein C8D89_12546 [Actinomycetospora cinnamomea]
MLDHGQARTPGGAVPGAPARGTFRMIGRARAPVLRNVPLASRRSGSDPWMRVSEAPDR